MFYLHRLFFLYTFATDKKMAMEFKYNISNFIKALQIIEKYSVTNYYPYSIVDDYHITFNVDYEKARNMPDEDRIALEDLGISVENGYIYTEEYNI